MSKYPKVQLGLLLGVSKEAIVNNFGIYFITLLKGHFAGSRTAFLSSAGPASWYELEQLQAELTYLKRSRQSCCKEALSLRFEFDILLETSNPFPCIFFLLIKI